MFKTALQTITWGDPQHHLFDHILGQARAAGFQGVEIGFRRLGQVSIDEFRSLLDKHELELSASHVGGNLVDLTQAADERAGLDVVLKCLEGLGSRYLIYSGLNIPDDEALDAEIARIGDFAERCADRGVTLLYHNHDWEFRDDCRIWKRLRAAQIASLGFAPDLGWAAKAGYGIATLLDELGPALKVLHFKDFASQEDGQNTCHLGTGVIDFAPAWAWLARHREQDLWLTAEQDFAEDNDQACAVNGAYLRDQLTSIGT